MRSRLFCIALLPLFVLALALPAHADPMDDFTITTTGITIDFSLPASTTGQFDVPFGQDNFGQVSGTVNGLNELIGVNFITGYGCAECQTILLNYPSASWTIDLPALYAITDSGTFPNQVETLTFIPGDYMTGAYNDSDPFDRSQFEIKVTPETAATPEPPTLFLSAFAAASVCGLLLMKRRVLG